MGGLLICREEFDITASQERVWRLIGKVVFSALPGMENLEILDENNFRALLRMKLFSVPVTMRIAGEITNLEPYDCFEVKLALQGPGGCFSADQKVRFVMKPKAMETSLVCTATLGKMGLLPRVLFLGTARRFARATFDAIGKRLQELA